MKKYTGKINHLFRWGITLTTILLILIYQLGMETSSADFSKSEKNPRTENTASQTSGESESLQDDTSESAMTKDAESSNAEITSPADKEPPSAAESAAAGNTAEAAETTAAGDTAEAAETTAAGDTAEAAETTDDNEEDAGSDSYGPWTDGTYSGTAEGYGGPVTIEAVIRQGWIAEITIIDASGEDKAYLRDAKKIIPKVIEKQHTDLDAISGATTTTWAILNAIDYSLEEALR